MTLVDECRAPRGRGATLRRERRGGIPCPDLSAVHDVPDGWCSASSPSASQCPSPGPNPRAVDDVLREKGLTRVGQVYLLRNEDDLTERIAEVRRLTIEFDQAKARLAEDLTTLGRTDAAVSGSIAEAAGAGGGMAGRLQGEGFG